MDVCFLPYYDDHLDHLDHLVHLSSIRRGAQCSRSSTGVCGVKKKVTPPLPHTRLLRCPSFLRASLKVHKWHMRTVRSTCTACCTTANQIYCTYKTHFHNKIISTFVRQRNLLVNLLTTFTREKR